MFSVLALQCVRIVEDLGGFAETNAVLFQIGDGLFIIPFELHLAFLVPVRYECTATRGNSLSSPSDEHFVKLSGSLILAEIKFYQLFSGHGGKGISLSCVVAELDFKDAIVPFLNNCSNLATAQSF